MLIAFSSSLPRRKLQISMETFGLIGRFLPIAFADVWRFRVTGMYA
jgi:hypothetical protein